MGYKHTEEAKRKISKALEGENNPRYGNNTKEQFEEFYK